MYLEESLISSSHWVDMGERLAPTLIACVAESHCKPNTKPSHVLYVDVRALFENDWDPDP